MSRFRASGSLLIGATITLIILAMALVSLFWTPYPPTKIDIIHKLATPSGIHWLGTDPFGRDVFSMIMAGARSSLSVALIAVVVGAGIGIPLGALASSLGGWVDNLVMRFTDLALAPATPCWRSASSTSRSSPASPAAPRWRCASLIS